MFAPKPQLTACLHVLRLATVHARLLAWSKGPHEHIAALMDAVHTIPNLLGQWEKCGEALLLDMLGDYDTAWGGDLRAEYERVVSS